MISPMPGYRTVDSDDAIAARWADADELAKHELPGRALVIARFDMSPLTIGQEWQVRQYVIYPDRIRGGIRLILQVGGIQTVLPESWAPQRTREGLCPCCVTGNHDLKDCPGMESDS